MLARKCGGGGFEGGFGACLGGQALTGFGAGLTGLGATLALVAGTSLELELLAAGAVLDPLELDWTCVETLPRGGTRGSGTNSATSGSFSFADFLLRCLPGLCHLPSFPRILPP